MYFIVLEEKYMQNAYILHWWATKTSLVTNIIINFCIKACIFINWYMPFIFLDKTKKFVCTVTAIIRRM